MNDFLSTPLPFLERRFPKASGGNSSCDEDSNDSLSPRQSESREHPVGIEPVCSSAEKLAGSNLLSLIKVRSLVRVGMWSGDRQYADMLHHMDPSMDTQLKHN